MGCEKPGPLVHQFERMTSVPHRSVKTSLKEVQLQLSLTFVDNVQVRVFLKYIYIHSSLLNFLEVNS